MRAIFVATLMAVLSGGVALAQTRPPPTLEQQADETARALRDALEKAMRLFEGMVGSIPQYEAPEVLPNGDIIIRRVPPAQRQPPHRLPAPPPTPKKAPADPKQEET